MSDNLSPTRPDNLPDSAPPELPTLAHPAGGADTGFMQRALMRGVSGKDAKFDFGRLIDIAGAEPVARHGLPVVGMITVAEFAQFKALERLTSAPSGKPKVRA